MTMGLSNDDGVGTTADECCDWSRTQIFCFSDFQDFFLDLSPFASFPRPRNWELVFLLSVP